MSSLRKHLKCSSVSKRKRWTACVSCYWRASSHSVSHVRGVRNPLKMPDISFLKTEPNRPQNSKTENSVSAVRFSENRLWQFGNGFSCCLIHSSSCNMIGSTVTQYFSSCYISALLVLSHFGWQLLRPIQHRSMSVECIHIKQHTVQKPNWKKRNRD